MYPINRGFRWEETQRALLSQGGEFVEGGRVSIPEFLSHLLHAPSTPAGSVPFGFSGAIQAPERLPG